MVRTERLRWLIRNAERRLGQLVPMGGEGAHHPHAAQVLFHAARDDGVERLHALPGNPQRHAHAGSAPGDEGHEAKGAEPSPPIRRDQPGRADGDQQGYVDGPQEPGFQKTAHALDIEHAARDEIAGMHFIVEGEAEALQFGKIGQAQIRADALGQIFLDIALIPGEQAAHRRNDDNNKRGDLQRAPRRCGGAWPRQQQRMRLVHRDAKKMRRHQVEQCRAHGDENGARQT